MQHKNMDHLEYLRYKKYTKARSTLYKLISKHGIEPTIDALVDTLVDVAETDALQLVETAILSKP